MSSLLVVERLVIESLVKKERNVQELAIDTGLEIALVQNILPNLLFKNIVRYNRGIYNLNMNEKEQWLAEINAPKQVQEETKDLFTSLVNRYFKDQEENYLRLKKVWLTKEEESVLNAMISNLDTFLKSVEQNKRDKAFSKKLCEKRLVFWGYSDYAGVVQETLEAV